MHTKGGQNKKADCLFVKGMEEATRDRENRKVHQSSSMSCKE